MVLRIEGRIANLQITIFIKIQQESVSSFVFKSASQCFDNLTTMKDNYDYIVFLIIFNVLKNRYFVDEANEFNLARSKR